MPTEQHVPHDESEQSKSMTPTGGTNPHDVPEHNLTSNKVLPEHRTTSNRMLPEHSSVNDSMLPGHCSNYSKVVPEYDATSSRMPAKMSTTSGRPISAGSRPDVSDAAPNALGPTSGRVHRERWRKAVPQQHPVHMKMGMVHGARFGAATWGAGSASTSGRAALVGARCHLPSWCRRTRRAQLPLGTRAPSVRTHLRHHGRLFPHQHRLPRRRRRAHMRETEERGR